LIVASQAPLRAELARIFVSAGYEVELASDEGRARLLIGTNEFDAAVISPRSVEATEFVFLRDVQNAVGKLVILAPDLKVANRFASSFPDALVSPTSSVQQERLLTFLREPTAAIMKDEGPPDTLHFSGCTLDLAGHTFVNSRGQQISLTRGEFSLLVTLVRNAGRVLSRAQLLGGKDTRHVEAYDRSIDMLIARLRRKIEADQTNPRLITTVAGAGYKFTGGAVGQEAASTEAEREDRERRLGRSERRPVTVLSCQIIGFAALSAKLDPEDLELAIAPVYQTCGEIVERFRGTIVRALGDNVLACFGHPEVHENDAENAVRAALALVDRIGQIKAGSIGNLRARVGIATSLSVVDPVNFTFGRQPSTGGEALTLALHMQEGAPVDGVVIAASTRDLVGRFFGTRELKPVLIEGIREPAQAWCVIEETEGIARFDALHRDAMVQLIGREGELEYLMQRWSKVLQGNGQVVLLAGDAGIGKSRLVAALEERLQAQAHLIIRFTGSPYTIDAPMSVLLEELQRSCGFLKSDTAATRLDKLRNLFAAVPTQIADPTELFAGILGIAITGSSTEGNQMSPQRRKDLAFKSLAERLYLIAENAPLLVIAEDAQWIDATSIEFFAYLVERITSLRAILVVTCRPEFTPPWANHSYVATLTLSRLSRSDSAALLREVAGERRLFPQMEAEIISRADGIPLFIEELTKSLLEDTTKLDDAKPRLGYDPEDLPSIPKTLQALLVARIDRLTRGKFVAQAGAVIGQEFSFELLQVLTEMNEPTLLKALDELVDSGLLFRRGSTSQVTFTFKHALVRDAANNLLLRHDRQRFHAILSRAYEERFPETAQAHPELLAFHCREAGEPIRAIGYLLRAAEQALQRSAVPDALAHLARARKLVATLPNNENRLKLELKLEICLGRTLTAEYGYAASQTRHAYNRAREICEALRDELSLPLIVLGQWLSTWNAADHRAAIKQARELYEWGRRKNEKAGMAAGHLALGMSLSAVGELVQARQHLEDGLHINQFNLADGRALLASDTDGRITLLSYLHDCLLLMGFPDQARSVASEATLLKPQQLYSCALAQLHTARMQAFERDPVKAAETSASALQLSEAQGYSYFVGVSKVYRGWSLAQQGDTNQGISLCERGLAELESLGAKSWLPRYLALLAECHERANDVTRGAQVISDAQAALEATGERLWEAEIYRLKGLFLLRSGGKTDAVEECFRLALHKARQQHAKLLELRAATSLARLFKKQGALRKGRELLLPIYSWFTEGFDFIDVCEARSVLNYLPPP
jgi:predicted ATPase/DNA-binding response OmpR family regulator/class 3 adenylate cyclase